MVAYLPDSSATSAGPALVLPPVAETAGGEASPIRTPTVKVLHVINGEHYAGAERVQDLLALALPRFGYEADFACLKPGRFAEMRKSQQSRLIELPMRSRFDLSQVRRLARLLQEGGYKLLHAHTPRSALLGAMAAAWAGVPLAYHVHSPTARDSTRKLQNSVNAAVESLAARRAAALIAVSTSLAEDLRRRGFRPERIWVVPNGVPAPVRRRSDEAPVLPFTLGMVALMRPRKGVEVLLDAVAMLRGRGRRVQLRAIGPFETAEYEVEVLRRAEELKLGSAVTWTGFTRDVNAELAQLDAFVLPSLFGEGMPMVVLEAMAAGVPVAASRVEGVPQVIRDGCDGLLTSPGDAAELAAAIEQLMDQPELWRRLRDSAMTRHAEHFSDRAMAEGVAAIYDRLLAQAYGRRPKG